MKKILFVLITIFSFVGNAQEKKEVTTPVLTVKLLEGESYNWEDYSLTFKEVVVDSRCPSDVTCVWAGEAKVKLILKKDGKIIEEKVATILNPDNKGAVFMLGENKFKAYGLLPYPTTKLKKSTKEIDYYLRVEILSEILQKN